MKAIGIDIGGTKIEGVLADEKGKVYKKIREETPENKKAITNKVLEIISTLKEKNVKSAGIGIPGVVDNKGKPHRVTHLPSLNNYDIGKEIAKKTNLKIYLENDANCFALAEQGSAKNMIGVIIGTGIGAGIIANGQLVRGADGSAGEIGAMIERESHLDFQYSGPALTKKYGGNKAPDEIWKLRSKDEKAKKIYEDFLNSTAKHFFNLSMALNPEKIVLGGGVSNVPFYKELNNQLEKLFKEAAKKHPEAAGIKKSTPKIVKAKISDSAGSIGAALLAIQNI